MLRSLEFWSTRKDFYLIVKIMSPCPWCHFLHTKVVVCSQKCTVTAANVSFNWTLVADQLSWSNIPDVVLIKIYKNLSFLDRARASSVCKHWHYIYKLPELWHKFEFEFTQESTSYIKSTPPRLVKQVIQQYAKHLKYVTIKVDSHQVSTHS